ncbi:hypothetical protein RXV86_03145 [Alisedimentitalea sp. MJ-SS2]|uniref:hypothetical protein n=1 Tax=Aliisedimentitalea sp. MJ-SS2 TaxID=3049795 RepID=UPI0029114315|nr:hypothetical protein [Alisedimentitalea sp. MJ-SS2]MDU8926372.1 hypothetical protein [Alisedimentitalea sp. MJ-SS2]
MKEVLRGLRTVGGARQLNCGEAISLLGWQVPTRQSDPEMKPASQSALIDELDGDLPAGVRAAARPSKPGSGAGQGGKGCAGSGAF